MNEPEVSKTLDRNVLDEAQTEEVAGGGDVCSADDLVELTAALKEAYDNLVDFTSYVIERVSGAT